MLTIFRAHAKKPAADRSMQQFRFIVCHLFSINSLTANAELERAKAAGEDILRYCIAAGGTITGEQGVGMEKNEMMDKLFSPIPSMTSVRMKTPLDPSGRLNPGNVLPTGRGCMEMVTIN